MDSDGSAKLFERARRRIPGGVNSPVRAWKSVGGAPRFIARGEGACVFDVDRGRYIDFVASWGALILGHAHPGVVQAVEEALQRGSTFGAPTAAEVEFAEVVSEFFPAVEKLRLVSSGTEAAMSAIRLARGFTGRNKVVKFDGCYHGHADSLLVRAGSGVATLALPETLGVPPAFAAETLVAYFNDVASVAAVFEKYGGEIAAVIVEPVCGNMGVIPPERDFLPALGRITRQHGALLIFDEVITGFRVSPGGAQELYGIRPDLTCLGKILGGGLPLGAFGGRGEIMDMLAPEGPVYQAGTLSGNPLAVAAGLATLRALSGPGIYAKLEAMGKGLQEGLENILKKHGIPGVVNRAASMLTLFFGVERVRDAAAARRSDAARFARFFHGMISRGLYFPPSPFEAFFLSAAHSDSIIEETLSAVEAWAREDSQG